MANSIYANGIVSALSQSILGEERLNRMIDSASANDALKVLSEINFGDGLSLSSPLEFEKLIAIEEAKLFSLIKSTSASEKLKKFILFKNDYHNAEVFIKQKHLKIDADKMLTADGLYEKNFIKDKIFSDDYSAFPSSLKNALLECDNLFVSSKATGEKVGAIFSKALFDELYSATKFTKFLRKILLFKIDCTNIGVALRVRNYNKAKDFFVDNGKLSKDDLKKLSELPFEEIKNLFRFSDYNTIILKAIDDAEVNKPLSVFEKLLDYYPLEILKKYSYSISGNIPFYIYVFNKLNDIINVRIILIGLINGLDKNQIKNRLRGV